jgi:glutaconate CoA-transferase, subunit B
VTDWTPREMMAVAAAHEIAENDVIIVGLGLPQIAALLAKATRAPAATLLLELGVFDPTSTEPAMGIADPRMWAGTNAFGGMLDVLGHLLHSGRVTLGILGALEIDPTGAINTSTITAKDGSKRRFNGSGGGNDIASLAGRVMVVMRHDPRKFRQRVEFLTSPGRRINGRSRAEAGLPGLGTTTIVTDRAVIDIDETGLVLRSAHPGEDPEAIATATPVPLRCSGAIETPPPSPHELDLIRDRLDPAQWYTA